MAIISAEELNNQVVDLYTGTDYFYGLLLNAPGTTFTGASTLEDVLAFEVNSSIGGYERQEFYYVSGDINTYSGGVSVDAKRITFTNNAIAGPSTNWDVTHVAVIRSPLTLSASNVKSNYCTFNQSATGVDIVSNRLTVSSTTFLANGYAAIVYPASGQSLPAGITADTVYYVKVISSGIIELYTTSALSTIVDITGVSAGIGFIKNANGNLFGTYALPSSVTVAGTQSVIYDISVKQGQ